MIPLSAMLVHVLVMTRIWNWLWKFGDPNVRTRLWKVYVTSFAASLAMEFSAVKMGNISPEDSANLVFLVVPIYAVFFYFDYCAVSKNIP